MKISTLFTPNKYISAKAMKTLVLSQISFVILVWIFSPTVFLPKPTAIFSSLGELWYHWDLGNSLITSMELNVEAIILSSIVSLGLMYASTINFFKPMVLLISKLRFLSMAGLTFFFTIMTSNGHQLKLSILVFSVSVFFITGLVDVLMSIPKEQYDLARTLRMNNWHILWEVVVLGQIDKAFDVMRQNAAMSYMMLTMVESMSRSSGGVGALLMTQQRYLNLSAIFGIQIIVLLLGILQDVTIGWIKNKLCCPYASLTLEHS